MLDRVDLATGEVRVWGKGAKERIVPVGAAALAAIRAWLPVRAGIANARSQGDVRRAGAASGSRRASIERRLAEWAVPAGLVAPRPSAHAAAFVRVARAAILGRPARRQEMLGHASIASTQVYTHLDFQYLAKAYDARAPARQAQEG